MVHIRMPHVDDQIQMTRAQTMVICRLHRVHRVRPLGVRRSMMVDISSRMKALNHVGLKRGIVKMVR